MNKVKKLLEDLGAKGGIGFLLVLVGIGISLSEKIEFENIGHSVRNLPPWQYSLCAVRLQNFF